MKISIARACVRACVCTTTYLEASSQTKVREHLFHQILHVRSTKERHRLPRTLDVHFYYSVRFQLCSVRFLDVARLRVELLRIATTLNVQSEKNGPNLLSHRGRYAADGSARLSKTKLVGRLGAFEERREGLLLQRFNTFRNVSTLPTRLIQRRSQHCQFRFRVSNIGLASPDKSFFLHDDAYLTGVLRQDWRQRRRVARNNGG